MSRFFKLSYTITFWSCTVLMLSCGSNASNESASAASVTPATTDAAATTVAQAVAAKPANFTGTFNAMIAKRESFVDLTPSTKTVYSHTFDEAGTPMLKGWMLDENNKFEPTTIDFEKGDPTGANFGPGVYFGNVVLRPAEYNKLRRALRQDKTMLYVIFSPKLVDNYYIGYDISISATKSFAAGHAFAPVADANPSPPKTY